MVPLTTPTAKNAKYMIAAGIFCILGRIGGSDKPTDWRLFMPMMTSRSRIKTRKIVLSSSLMFISRFDLSLGGQTVKGKMFQCQRPVVATEENDRDDTLALQFKGFKVKQHHR